MNGLIVGNGNCTQTLMSSSVPLCACVKEWKARNLDKVHSKYCVVTQDVIQNL
jgi:hypothetical protein